MANATQHAQRVQEQMQSLTATISNLQTRVNNHSQCGGCGGRRNGRPPPQYCWTHGNFAHGGATCNTKSEGQIDNATYSNFQGRSTNNCHWLITSHANHDAILDSGASGHYLDAAAKQHCIKVHLTDTGPSVQVTN
jgi:hypothetical protein